MKMTLARKGLLTYIMEMKSEEKSESDWDVKDMKTYGIIAQGLEVEHQSKIHHAKRSMDFAWKKETVGDVMGEYRKMTILLGSFPADYEMIVTILENSTGLTLMDVKEKLLKEYEKKQQKETSEDAFRVQERRHNSVEDVTDAIRWVGHKQFECGTKAAKNMNEVAFTVHDGGKQGWLLDSGTSSHMTPTKEDFIEYRELKDHIDVRVADGAKMEAIGKGKFVFRCKDSKMVTVQDVAHTGSG
uniref:Putative polyprotein n=1 Tax=Albugo laibachii Nc14 TaxID=890382 RepID=F0X0D0_9STRA|nr:putative polyprotein [Albugo laibachii Nc14]|eukprot:CCA27214.1 putative polyprotein [Albugo laibachii Nc14]